MSEKTYELSLKDRVSLLNVLPHEGNIVALRVIRELQFQLGFSEVEISDYAITLTQVGSSGSFRTSWNVDGEKAVKTVKIGAYAESLIADRLKKLSDEKVLPLAMISLYERFVEKKEVLK